MKAQSAVEYLVTYGWMLVAIAVTSGAVYNAVGSGCVESSSGFIGTSIGVNNYGLTTSNELGFALENREAYEVQIDRAVLDDGTTLDLNTTIDPGSEEEVRIEGFRNSESCNTLDIEIVYTLQDLENQRVSGTLTGPYEVGGSTPVAPTNLQASFTGS